MNTLENDFWASLPLGRGVQLLTHDAPGMVALAKPAGVLAHPNTAADQPRALLTARYALDGEFYEWTPSGAPAPVRLWLLNRLDSATSGVILAAANEPLAREVRAQFRRKQVRKTYNALVFGRPKVPRQVWHDRLMIEKHGGQVRTSGAGNIPCESHMQILHRVEGPPALSLLQLEPRTGRSHQLRVQCAMRHLPIVGDATYGDFGRNREFAKACGSKRLFLHSLATRFEYEFAGRTHAFAAEAPLPAEFTAALAVGRA